MEVIGVVVKAATRARNGSWNILLPIVEPVLA